MWGWGGVGGLNIVPRPPYCRLVMEPGVGDLEMVKAQGGLDAV